MDSTPRNIVIIGGGVIGCTTAYYLTRHEKYNPEIHQITILEATGIASSASGKAGGLLGLWANRAVETVPLSFRLHEQLAREHDGDSRWGYRRLDGCGTIDTKLEVHDLPPKERAAFPQPGARKFGSKRQKLRHSAATRGDVLGSPSVTPGATTLTPILAPLKPDQPPDPLPTDEVYAKPPSNHVSTPLPYIDPILGKSGGAPNFSVDPTGAILNQSAITSQPELPVTLTGSSTRWRSHRIEPNGDYYIGDFCVGFSSQGSVKCTSSRLSDDSNKSSSKKPAVKVDGNGDKDTPPQQIETVAEAKVIDGCEGGTEPSATAKEEVPEEVYGEIIVAPEPSLEEDPEVPAQLETIVVKGLDPERQHANICTPAAQRRSERRRKPGDADEPTAAAGSATKPRGKSGRKDRAGQFPNSCVFPPDLTWINRDLVSSYRKQGAGDSGATAQVHPYHFTHWMARLAQDRGVRVRQGVQATRVVHDPGRCVHAVELLERNSNVRSCISAVTDVLVAAGSWTSTLLPRSEIHGVRAHSVVWEVDVSPHAVFTKINLPKGYVPSHRLDKGEKAPPSRKAAAAPDPEAYARPFKEVYACGAVDRDVELPATADQVTVDERRCDDIITWLGLVSPVLADAAVKAKQACYMPLRDDGAEEPMFGRTLTPGLWLAAGHSCWGIQNAPACGLLMAEMLMDGKATSVDEDAIAAYDPRAFGV